MLDIVDALFLGAIAATVAIALIGSAAISLRAKIVAYFIAAMWTILIVAIAAFGGFGSGAPGPFPTPVLAFLILVVAGLAAWFARPAFRLALLSVPLAGLIGVNVLRILGVNFLILHHQGASPRPSPSRLDGATSLPAQSRSRWQRWSLSKGIFRARS